MKRKIFIFALVAILVVGGGVIFLWALGNKTLQDQELAAQGFKKIEQPDSDGDGLADWEEELWETDPQKSDTDGDGTSDGEEIKARRDPRRAGPNDEIKGAPENLNILVHSALKKDDSDLIIPDKPMESPVVDRVNIANITNDHTVEEAVSYGEKFLKSIEPYISYPDRNPQKYLIENLNGNNDATKEKLNNYNLMVSKTISTIMALSTPKEASEAHTKLITQLKKMVVLIENMMAVEDQPIIALQAGQQFPLERAYASQAILDINEYLIKYGVSLPPEVLSTLLKF